MARSVALCDSDGTVALGTPQQQHPPPSFSAASLPVKKMAPIPIPSGSGESWRSEGDVHSALGESYVNGARRHLRVTGVGRSTQEEEEEEEPDADRRVLGLLAQI